MSFTTRFIFKTSCCNIALISICEVVEDRRFWYCHVFEMEVVLRLPLIVNVVPWFSRDARTYF